MSGLLHAQKLMDSARVQTGEYEPDQYSHLPAINNTRVSQVSVDHELGSPVSEDELVKAIQKL